MFEKILEEFFTCPICIEVINNPITTTCGHNYCKSCINLNLRNCPICKAEMNFLQLSINFQLKNLIESLKNYDQNEIKNKYFPEIKAEEKKRDQEFKIIYNIIFGQDFLLCENYQCKEIIKNLALKILSNDKPFLNSLINSLNKSGNLFIKENIQTNKIFENDLLCIECKTFIRNFLIDKTNIVISKACNFDGEYNILNSLLFKNSFRSIEKHSRKKILSTNNNKENQPFKNEKMEFEVSTEKYFNNSNRGKKLSFYLKDNSENVFRLKRNRCELIEKINQSNQSPIIKSSNNLNLQNFLNIKHINRGDCITENKLSKINYTENTARRIQFDSLEVDRNINLILQNFSNNDMLFYPDPVEANGTFNNLQNTDTKCVFSNLISYTFNENTNNLDNYNPNYHNNSFNQIPNHNILKNISNQTYVPQNLPLNLHYPKESENTNQNLTFQNNTIEYESKRRKL